VWSLGVYGDLLRLACLRCKQRGHSPLTLGLTTLLCAREMAELLAFEPDCVVPVPHHWIDRLRQPEHAADAVARGAGRFLNVPVERHILSKIQWTQKQSRLSSSARRNHLRSAFRVPRTIRLNGLKILLADDVVTTGTTAERATQALRAAGAAEVCVIALARAVGA
jgi:predicted amidophosphoribosyltransferase